MNILIIGAGAIGCLVSSRLTHNIHREKNITVTLAGRQSLVDAFEKQGGLRITERDTTQTIKNIYAAASIFDAYKQVKVSPTPELDAFDFDLVIFTVKSYDTKDAAIELTREIKARGGKQPVVMSLQNGVGNETVLADAGFKQIIAGSITTPVSVLGPADIRIDKSNSSVGLSIWTHEQKHNNSETYIANDKIATWPFFYQVSQLFSRSNFRVENYRSAQSMKWTKLLMNMLGNASSAILNQPPEKIFSDNALADLEIEAWREALTVMDSVHIRPINMGKYPFQILAPLILRLPKSLLRVILRKQVTGGRGGKMPSLHIDLHSGKGRNEVGWLNGAVVELGGQVEIPTPINQLFTELVLSLVDDKESRKAWSGETKRLVQSAEKYRKWSQKE